MRRCGALIASTLTVCAWAQPAAAEAAQISFRGIDGARLSMSEAKVRAELGRPSSRRTASNRGAVVLTYKRRKLEVTVDRATDQVVGVKTTSRSHRTSSGAGVGITEGALRRKLRGERCVAVEGQRICTVKRSGVVMDFISRAGTVVRVAVTRAGG